MKVQFSFSLCHLLFIQAAKEKAQQERESLNRTMNMSRGGSRRGHDRDGPQVTADGWTMPSGPPRPTNKAGDLSNFGKISKSATGPMQFGPTSVFSSKRDGGKRDSAQLSRTSSSSNMFMMLNAETPAETSAPPPVRPSRPPSRTASVDLSQGAGGEAAQRPKLNLLPRSKPALDKEESSPAPADEVEEGEIRDGEPSAAPAMSKDQAEKKIDQDIKEFFAIRNLDEAEEYFIALPEEFHHLLVDKLVMRAIESKESDAQLVGDFFERGRSKNLCSLASLEEGFTPTAEILGDIAIDAPKAFDLMAIMIKGAKFPEEQLSRVAGKSEDSDKLLELLS